MADKPYYEDGYVTLWNCDEHELRRLEFDLLLTDVPYNLSKEHKEGGLRSLDYGDWDDGFDIEEFLERWLPRCRKAAYVWCNETQVSAALAVLREHGFIDRSLVWAKPNPTVLNGQQIWLPGVEHCAFGKRPRTEFHLHCHPGWWIEAPDQPRLHPNQKPLRVIHEQVFASSSPGDVIVDPFAGSGTTGVAAKQLGRRAVLVERRLEACEVAAARLSQEVLELGPPARSVVGRGIRAVSAAEDPDQLEVIVE